MRNLKIFLLSLLIARRKLFRKTYTDVCLNILGLTTEVRNEELKNRFWGKKSTAFLSFTDSVNVAL